MAARHLTSVPYKRDTKGLAQAPSSLQIGAVLAACAPGDSGDAAGTWLQSSSSLETAAERRGLGRSRGKAFL